jgi:hypothetical protein
MCRIGEIINMAMNLNSELVSLNCFACLELSLDHTCTTNPNEFKYHALGHLLSRGLVTQDEYNEAYNYL